MTNSSYQRLVIYLIVMFAIESISAIVNTIIVRLESCSFRSMSPRIPLVGSVAHGLVPLYAAGWYMDLI
jgi:hypothetical protein